MIAFDDGQTTIHVGDVRDVLRALSTESVNCVITSPPYWGLRDYGTATWEGGLASCEHKVSELRRGVNLRESEASTRGGAIKPAEIGWLTAKDTCPHCGAVRIDQQIGLESTPEAYVCSLVEIFREVRRVLRKDGLLWLVIGDSYVAKAGKGDNVPDTKWKSNSFPSGAPHRMTAQTGLKPKDLVGIPWRVALALQADGWHLRSDIIWAKPNPMPESVADRCTKSHEYVFMLSKSEHYWSDFKAIREPAVEPDRKRADRVGGANGHTVRHSPGSVMGASATRNKRDVWTVATAPYKEAHFAVFPPKLVEPMILAGCPLDGVVLDPFMGSGTALMVARQIGRRGLGIDLNPEYVSMAMLRIGVAAQEYDGWCTPCRAGEHDDCAIIDCECACPSSPSGTLPVPPDRR